MDKSSEDHRLSGNQSISVAGSTTPFQIGSSRISEHINTFHHYFLGNQIHPKYATPSEIIEIPFDEQSIEPTPSPKRSSKIASELPSRIQEPRVSSQDNFMKIIMQKSYVREFIDKLKRKAYIYPNTPGLQQLLTEKYMMQKQTYIEQPIITTRLPLFEPTSKFILLWEFMQFLQMLFITWWGPFVMSFRPDSTLNTIILENFVLYYNILDIFIKTNRSIIVQGQILSNRQTIILYYLKTEFMIDLMSIAVLVMLNTSNYELSEELIISLAFVQVYLNYRRVTLMITKLKESFDFIDDAIELINVLLVIFFFAHITACIWHKVGIITVQQGMSSWLTDFQHNPILDRYNHAFYWATMTMVTVGYGDITPQNQYEMVCSNVIMLISSTIFAFSMNSIGIILKNINDATQKFRKTQIQINSYMNKNQVNPQLQGKIRNYLKYTNEQDSITNDSEITSILNKLSSSLRQELIYEIQSKPLDKCTILSQFSPKTQKEIAYALESQQYAPSERIYQQHHSEDNALYIINEGDVKIVEENSGKTLKQLKKGESFGELEFLTGQPRHLSAYSVTFTQIYRIRRDTLLALLPREDYEKYCYCRDQIMVNSNYEPAGLQCYGCSKNNHNVTDCPGLLYKPDCERIRKMEDFQLQTRTFMKRGRQRSQQSLLYNKEIEQKCEKFQEEMDQQEISQTIEQEAKSELGQHFTSNSSGKIVVQSLPPTEQRPSFTHLEKSLYSVKKPKIKIQAQSQNIPSMTKLDAEFTHGYKIREKQSTSSINAVQSSQYEEEYRMLDEFIQPLQFCYANLDRMGQFKHYFPQFNITSVLILYSKLQRTFKLKVKSIYSYSFYAKSKQLIQKKDKSIHGASNLSSPYLSSRVLKGRESRKNTFNHPLFQLQLIQ